MKKAIIMEVNELIEAFNALPKTQEAKESFIPTVVASIRKMDMLTILMNNDALRRMDNAKMVVENAIYTRMNKLRSHIETIDDWAILNYPETYRLIMGYPNYEEVAKDLLMPYDHPEELAALGVFVADYHEEHVDDDFYNDGWV